MASCTLKIKLKNTGQLPISLLNAVPSFTFAEQRVPASLDPALYVYERDVYQKSVLIVRKIQIQLNGCTRDFSFPFNNLLSGSSLLSGQHMDIEMQILGTNFWFVYFGLIDGSEAMSILFEYASIDNDLDLESTVVVANTPWSIKLHVQPVLEVSRVRAVSGFESAESIDFPVLTEPKMALFCKKDYASTDYCLLSFEIRNRWVQSLIFELQVHQETCEFNLCNWFNSR